MMSTKTKIYNMAVKQFALLGYGGTSIRTISSQLGIQVAGIYYYFPGKQDILFEIMNTFMDFLHEKVHIVLESAAPVSPQVSKGHYLEVFQEAMAMHIICHVQQQSEAFIADTELRSLTTENRYVIVAKRDAYEGMFRELLRKGIQAGDFIDMDEKLTSKAILSMSTGVASWFNPEGAKSVHDVASAYVDLAVAGISTDRD